MIDVDIKMIKDVQILGGSSTLLLGTENYASLFLDVTIYKHSLRRGMFWLHPQTIRSRNLFEVDGEDISLSNSTESFLEIPREIFYQTMGKKICLGGDFVFVKGVTGELVDKFDNQNSDGYKERCKKYIEKTIARNKDSIIDHEEYEDEYPAVDEFGNINKISWLRDYAMYADDFSKRNKVDIFLNLEWDRPKSQFPSPFWGIFDRIYKIERCGKKLKAEQLR